MLLLLLTAVCKGIAAIRLLHHPHWGFVAGEEGVDLVDLGTSDSVSVTVHRKTLRQGGGDVVRGKRERQGQGQQLQDL